MKPKLVVIEGGRKQEVCELLNEVLSEAGKIKQVIILGLDDDGTFHFSYNTYKRGNTLTVLGMLTRAIYDINTIRNCPLETDEG